jgi:hypothetical protein
VNRHVSMFLTAGISHSVNRHVSMFLTAGGNGLRLQNTKHLT